MAVIGEAQHAAIQPDERHAGRHIAHHVVDLAGGGPRRRPRSRGKPGRHLELGVAIEAHPAADERPDRSARVERPLLADLQGGRGTEHRLVIAGDGERSIALSVNPSMSTLTTLRSIMGFQYHGP